jgi:N-acetylmuramic acid 6-phosphate etherase
MPLPPDRTHVATEARHDRSGQLDALATEALVALMADDHRAVVDAVASAAAVIARLVDDVAPRMRRGGRLVYVGAGTSGRLGVLDAAECPPTFRSEPRQVVGIIAGGDGALRRSSEGREDDPDGAGAALADLGIGEADTVMGIAAGGTTPYVLGAIRLACERGARTAFLTCAAPPDGIRARCDHVIELRTGPELLTGSTRLKAGSATKLALNVISTAIFVRLGKVYGNLMVDLRATNAKLTDRAIRIIGTLCPGISREDAAALLREAGGDVKTAIVMQRLGVDAAIAAQRLDAVSGDLRAALE